MIVVDTNVIAYLLLPGERTADAEAAFQRDAEWIGPPLWRDEFLNVLCLYVRKQLLSLDDAVAVYEQAMAIVGDAAIRVSARRVFELSVASGCSGYDCEYVAVAQERSTRLVTTDQKLLAAFPSVAVALSEFAAGG